MAVKVPALLHKMSKSAQKAWYKKHGMEMPSGEEGKSAAAAKKVKVEPRKEIKTDPKSVRALNIARQKGYYAKGGRQPIGAGGSGGHSAMAGVDQSTLKGIKAGIKAGINPKVALVRYTNEETMNEVTKKEAEATLGGPVKEKPTMPSGKQPAGYRYVRGLARKAMKKGAVDAVHRSMERTMQKEDINEAIKDVADVGEYDYEGDMAKSQLRSILTNAKRLHDMLEDTTNLPEWVQSKITLAEDYILTAANYMEGEMNEETLAALEAELVEEIELFEKAPPGSKYERMVKHIKKGYAKGGLTPQEKSIAYATAWKAYNKAKNEEVEQLSEGPSHYQYSGTIHSNVGNAKHGEEKDDGHSYTITIPTGGVHQGDLGSFLSSKKAFSRISRENPHLEPHHVLAVMHGTGDDVEDVEVDHKGKTYKHRLYNTQEPDYLYEEVEQIEEKYMGFKALKASIAAKGGVRDPAAVAAAIGRKKYGKEKFQAMAAAGKKANEEVVTEAEGKVAVTPKEKALAAHHGDKTKITYGDVIKARIKSAAEKAMKKGN